MSFMQSEPEFIVGDLVPCYVITYSYNHIIINGLTLKVVNGYEIKSCYGESKNGKIRDYTAYVNDNKFSFEAYENLLSDITSLGDKAHVFDGNNASKYLFETYEAAEKVLTNILHHMNLNDISEIGKTLTEKYPESII